MSGRSSPDVDGLHTRLQDRPADWREDLPLIGLDAVCHVGTLEQGSRTDRPSLEGHCLSVSEDPDAWRYIARCPGPTWLLERPGGLWLDACALTDDQERRMREWSIEMGLAEPVASWRGWYHDGEADDWMFVVLEDEAAARAWMDAEIDDMEEGWPTGSGLPIEPHPGLRLTPLAMDLLQRWHDPLNAEGALPILFCALAFRDRPDVVGVWWDEIDDPASLSAPRGALLPSRWSGFTATCLDGRAAPSELLQSPAWRALLDEDQGPRP